MDDSGAPTPAMARNPLDHLDTRRRLYSLAFVDEFAPLYALFTLWFNDNDVSTSEISVVFIIWAALAVLLEVPD